jgi:hypothetical protein
MYQIEYDYKTGNSFGSHDETDILEITWINLAIAKRALARIKEHYLWYDGRNSSYGEDIPKPSWHDIEYDFCLKIPLDNGKEVQISAPWCGYFETLYGAKIIKAIDDDMSFTI